MVASRTRANRLMVDSIANSIHAARIDAWIGAFLIEARTIRRTVIVCDAFGVRANCYAIHNTTNAIVIAWRWLTWIDFVTLWFAFDEWIADRSIWTRTNRTVIHRFACGSIAAHIWARIDAFIIHAGLCSFTIGANYTFGMATSTSWSSIVARNAFADGRIARRTTNRIYSARRWIAWILRAQWFFAFHHDHAATEGVTSCARRTRTNRNVIRYGANCFGTAYANTWILTFVANARFAHRTIGISRTLWATSFVRIAMIFARALTHGMIIFNATTCIISAWCWNAWIFFIARNICSGENVKS